MEIPEACSQCILSAGPPLLLRSSNSFLPLFFAFAYSFKQIGYGAMNKREITTVDTSLLDAPINSPIIAQINGAIPNPSKNPITYIFLIFVSSK